MRIVNQKITVRRVLFSKPASAVYFLLFCFFAYKSILLLPIWLTVKDKAEQAQVDYNKKVALLDQKKQNEAGSQTDIGKERYQKDFFNKLDPGENLIVLYSNESTTTPEEQERKMFWWEQERQNFIVWWKNLQL